MSNEQMIRIPSSLAESAVDAFASVGMHDQLDALNAILEQPAEQHQGDPVAWTTQRELEILKSGNVASVYPNNVLTKIPVFLHADPGEVERLRAQLLGLVNAGFRMIGSSGKARKRNSDTLFEMLRELQAQHGE